MGLSNYDDAYYAQKAKEMAASESIWVVPFNGDPAFDNPPLPFWLTAGAYKVFGVSGYAAVFFPALMGVGTVWLTFLLARKLFDNEFTAFLSAFVLLFPGFFLDPFLILFSIHFFDLFFFNQKNPIPFFDHIFFG